MLVLVWVLSSFLDNIAAALIGGAMAHQLFRAKVHIGYLAAIVAASNAGGSFSVVGDTTTTMMWIEGVSPAVVFEAIIAASVALFIFGIPAAILQQKYSPILRTLPRTHPQSTGRGSRSSCSFFVLAIGTNVTVNTKVPAFGGPFSFHRRGGVGGHSGLGRRAPAGLGSVARDFQGLDLPSLARALRVDDAGRETAAASWHTAFGLGFLSAVFDNIPLTALALEAGRLRLGLSRLHRRLWRFDDLVRLIRRSGLTNLYPEARSVAHWIRHGWFVHRRLRRGVFCHAIGVVLASRRIAPKAARRGHFLALG